MKRYFKICNRGKMIIPLFAIMLILLPSVLLAQEPAVRTLKGYVVMGGGGGGDSESSNMRVEGGAYTTAQAVNILFGLGVPFTLNRDDTPSNLHDHPYPYYDNNFTDLGNRKKGEEVGLYGKIGFAPIKNTGFFIFGLGGFTWGEEIQLTQSNLTRRYYTESETTKTYGLFGGGIGYFPMQGHFTAQIQYDNRMGVTGSMGFAW